MSRVRKKRGWVYRGALASVTALAVAVGVLWVASFMCEITLDIPLSSSAYISFDAYLGSGYVQYDDFIGPARSGLDISFLDDDETWNPTEEWSFGLSTVPWGWTFYSPFWAPFLALSLWPTIVFVRWIRTRPRPGCCPACGYDLRGSTGSSTCPECGEAIPRPAVADAGT